MKREVDEFDMAEQEDANSKEVLTIQLTKPVKHDGEVLAALTFDFGKLTGNDSLKVEAELDRLGLVLLVPAFNGQYLIRIAAKACTTKIDSTVLQRLHINDYNRVRNGTRSFLTK